ncbi:transcriptional regulator, TetR family [Glaciecola sp. 4H-3-7+YE-5]|uniref:TetR/AcrR family transcriptional regulator n=1 Tax=uncultured Alteromonas sp. TaxID=179113 RepID=UPI00020A71AF|nr:transcriptional regulator, TetR family [Glaciecola sp. 4H-3-7+YE-5]
MTDNTKTKTIKKSSKIETLQRILDAARSEFAEKGIAKARVESIAATAGVTKQLIYHYYQSKEQLFAYVLDESSGDAMANLTKKDYADKPPREALANFIVDFPTPFKDPELATLAMEGIHYHDTHSTPRNQFKKKSPILLKKFSDIIERGIESGDFRADFSSEQLFAALGLISTGPYTNRYLISVLTGSDPSNEEAIQKWADFTYRLLLSALEHNRTSELL